MINIYNIFTLKNLNFHIHTDNLIPFLYILKFIVLYRKIVYYN